MTEARTYMDGYTDLIARLNNGWVTRPKRWSGDTHHDFPYGSLDDEATDLLMKEAADALEAAQAAIEQLRLKLLFNADAAKDREHAEKYLRQAENLLTSDERTLHAEVARLREKESSLDRLLALFKEVQVVADERDSALARLAEIEAGASPVEPSQAQPSDTAITYMTGYSDAKDWAATLPGAQTCSP